MFVIIGIVFVFITVFGGFFWASEFNPVALSFFLHPYEYLIIGGATIGSMIISNSMALNTRILKGVLGTFKGDSITKQSYLDLLKLLYETFSICKERRTYCFGTAC